MAGVDRTPLLAALLLIPRTLVLEQLGAMHGSTFISTGYMMTAIVLLSSWAAVVGWLCAKFARATFATVALLTLTTPFVFFDTVYTWPKLLGASYVLLSFGLLHGMSRRRRDDGWLSLALVAACASLAYLSHASNAFALVAVAALFAPTIVRQGAPAIALSALVAVLMLLPWTIWQAAVQPGGNALLRFALANDFGADDRSRPLLVSVVDAYSGLGVGGWISAKVEALRLLFGLNMSERLQEVGEVAKYLARSRPDWTATRVRLLHHASIARRRGGWSPGPGAAPAAEEVCGGPACGAPCCTGRARWDSADGGADASEGLHAPPSLWLSLAAGHGWKRHDRDHERRRLTRLARRGSFLFLGGVDHPSARHRTATALAGALRRCAGLPARGPFGTVDCGRFPSPIRFDHA